MILCKKLKQDVPENCLDLNGLHERVPILIADDFGAQCNKAKTQHEPAWDIFKGAFDTLGTKIGVLFASMGMPSGATQQIQEKYTHEIYVDRPWHAKYDKVDWQQNFGGWQAMQNKIWLHEFTFEPIPMEVYRRYDSMRLNLVDELLLQIDDAQIENEGPKTFRRLTKEDVEYIELVNRKGQVSYDYLTSEEGKKYKQIAWRCKTRGITAAVTHGKTYWYELTDFGYNMLTLIQTKRAEGTYTPASALKPLPALNP